MGQPSHFFAYLSKLRWIERWGMKRNAIRENVMEHSFEVAMIAHGLGVLHNLRVAREGGEQLDLGQLVLTALYHDASEVLTGDLPSPIKYHSAKIRDAYKEVEYEAEREMLAMLPTDMQESYAPFLLSERLDPALKKIIKSADLIVAYTKCLAETRAGNPEFSKAMTDIAERLAEIDDPDVQAYCQQFLPSFSLTLDELIKQQA